MEQNQDLRYTIFDGRMGQKVTAVLSSCEDGIVSGVSQAVQAAEALGLEVFAPVKDGMRIHAGEPLITTVGDPVQTTMAEDRLIGLIAKPSGIATAAHRALLAAEGRVRIVCGAFKKLSLADKHILRQAVEDGGLKGRIAEPPFVYLDKNYLRLFGGVAPAVTAMKKFESGCIVVQLKGLFGSVADEAREAIVSGAGILMIDTGNSADIDTVSEILRQTSLRSQVQIAFAGGIRIADIPSLCRKDVDILDIGREIIDAPLLDLKYDVVSADSGAAVPLNLMEKSELWIESVYLKNANLNALADAASDVLGIPRQDLLVVDVREDHITFDILSHMADAAAIIGKEQELLARLAAIDGVTLGPDAGVHSNGILGLIAVKPEESEELLSGIRSAGEQMRQAISHRAMIFPTGFELRRAMIEDTNSPYIARRLIDRGYEAVIGDPLPDDADAIAAAVSSAWEDGYGLVITSGGVGAEDKDKTVEGLIKLDDSAAIAWLVRFRKASGRHVKDGVRIAVAENAGALAISFPGPNDEVRLATEALLGALDKGCGKYGVAQAVSSVLREKLMRSAALHGHL